MRHVILIPDMESGGYVVEVPSLPGCYSQGETVEEALANIKEAIIGFEETLIELGDEVPQESPSIMEYLVNGSDSDLFVPEAPPEDTGMSGRTYITYVCIPLEELMGKFVLHTPKVTETHREIEGTFSEAVESAVEYIDPNELDVDTLFLVNDDGSKTPVVIFWNGQQFHVTK